MQRDREIHADFLAATIHRGNNAAGGQRDAALRKGQPITIHHQLQRTFDIVEIVERLAHAHHHDIRKQPAIGGIAAFILRLVQPRHAAFGPFAQRITRQHDLTDNLARRQIAHKAHRARMAEAAIERAADLAGDAKRSAIRIGDEDHFEIVPVGSAQQPFARAVGRVLGFDHFGPPDHEPLGQPGAHRLGDIGHRFEIGDAAMVEPVEYLFRAQLGLPCVQPCGCEQFGNARLGQPDQIHAPILARRYVTRDGNRVHLPGNAHQCRIGHHNSFEFRTPSTCLSISLLVEPPIRSRTTSMPSRRAVFTAGTKSASAATMTI